METRTTSVSAYCGSPAASSTGSGRSEAETVPLSTLVKATSSPPAARRGTASMLDVVYSERWPAPNTQGTFRLIVALLYQFFVVYVCNIPHCAQNVNRFHGESRDSISFFHPGGGAPLAFPQGGRKAPWDFITVKGTRYVFAGPVCRSVIAILHPPRSAGRHPPGKTRRSWAGMGESLGRKCAEVSQNSF